MLCVCPAVGAVATLASSQPLATQSSAHTTTYHICATHVPTICSSTQSPACQVEGTIDHICNKHVLITCCHNQSLACPVCPNRGRESINQNFQIELNTPGIHATGLLPCLPVPPGDGSQAIQLLGVQSMPTPATVLKLDFTSLLGPLFFTWIVQLLLPTILQQLVRGDDGQPSAPMDGAPAQGVVPEYRDQP